MTQNLKIITEKQSGKNISLVPSGKTFKAKGIEISADHKLIKFIPSESCNSTVRFWIKIDVNQIKIGCESVFTDEIRNLDTIAGVRVREPNGDYCFYHFYETKSSDYLEQFVRKFLVALGLK